MVYVGIDVAKDKHDCFIVNSDGEVLYDVFTIQNDMDGFEDLLFKIKTASNFENEGAFRLCCLALSVALAVFSQHLYAVCQGRRIFLTFFILRLDFL